MVDKDNDLYVTEEVAKGRLWLSLVPVRCRNLLDLLVLLDRSVDVLMLFTLSLRRYE